MRYVLNILVLPRPPSLSFLSSLSRGAFLPSQRNMSSSSPSGRTYAVSINAALTPKLYRETLTHKTQDAIDILNTFQSSFAQIEARRKAGIFHNEVSIREMKAYWARLGHSQDDLNRLNVLHVAGTKGKGSVCAFTASILARYPHRRLKIGLHTSPHLVAVRERIRLDGQPISEDVFARYFFEVYDLLSHPSTATIRPEDAEPGTKPIYARYLTLLAYHIFHREAVDVAIIETGLGGSFDATNIVDRPLATGISTMGIDHVQVLGTTIEAITAHKAGIMKPGCPAFAVEQVAHPIAEDLIRARAQEVGADLRFVGIDPRLDAAGVNVRPQAPFQRRNASLAIALAETTLAKLDAANFTSNGPLSSTFKDGIEQVVWRGRCEVKHEPERRVRWCIDGAHTTDSLRAAAKWFAEECATQKGPRVLIFNQQGRTEAVEFLDGLSAGSKQPDGTGFDYAFFCTNITLAATGYKRGEFASLLGFSRVA